MTSKTTGSPSPSSRPPSKSRLGDTLKELDLAIDEWDKITNSPSEEQDQSPTEMQKDTIDLLEKLKKQINELSND